MNDTHHHAKPSDPSPMVLAPPHTALADYQHLPVADAPSMQAMFEALQTHARMAGVALRAPPPWPTSCCGRGCNGCVWEGFFQAAHHWHQDAWQALVQAGCCQAATVQSV